MTTNTIALDKLPVPDIIESLSFEQILAEMKTALIALDPELANTLELESEPLTKLLEVVAYRELLIRQRVNNASKSVMLAYATGSDLDHLAANYNVERLIIVEPEPNAIPPIEAVYESDERLRQRVLLAFDSLSTAGSESSYIFHALSASGLVKDASVVGPPIVQPGEVLVSILSIDDSGVSNQALLDLVSAALSAEEVRPLTDLVTVQSANVIEYTIDAELIIYPGPDPELVLAEAQAAIESFTQRTHKLNYDINLSAIYGALNTPNVQKVILHSPSSDLIIDHEHAAFCININLVFSGTDE